MIVLSSISEIVPQHCWLEGDVNGRTETAQHALQTWTMLKHKMKHRILFKIKSYIRSKDNNKSWFIDTKKIPPDFSWCRWHQWSEVFGRWNEAPCKVQLDAPFPTPESLPEAPCRTKAATTPPTGFSSTWNSIHNSPPRTRGIFKISYQKLEGVSNKQHMASTKYVWCQPRRSLLRHMLPLTSKSAIYIFPSKLTWSSGIGCE